MSHCAPVSRSLIVVAGSRMRRTGGGITELDKTILSLKTQRNKLNDQMKLVRAL